MKNRWMHALAATAALVAMFATPARAISPEYFQLLNETQGFLFTLSGSITRPPVCTPMMVSEGQQALLRKLGMSAYKTIVVESLESGAKIAAAAGGLPGAAITSYGMVRCAMDAADARSFALCALGEAVSFRGGEVLRELNVGNLEQGVASYAWDKAYASMRGAIASYQAAPEQLDFTEVVSCANKVATQWTKRGRPGSEGGQIVISVNAESCPCRTGNELHHGSMRMVVPVRLARTGASQPGWSAGEPREIPITAACCSAPSGERSFGVLPGGDITGVPRDGAPPKADPPKTPPTRTATPGGTTRTNPPMTIPAPAPRPAGGQQWTVANPCPACRPIAAQLKESLANEARLAPQLAKAGDALRKTLLDTDDAKKRIADLQSQLNALAGTGGSSTDTGTGITTSSYVQPDGSVKVTRTDRNGKVIDEYTRPYATAQKLTADLKAQQARLAALNAAEPGQAREAARLDDAMREAERTSESLRAQLAACVEEKCKGDASSDKDIGVVPGGGGAGDKDKTKEPAGKKPPEKKPAKDEPPGKKQDPKDPKEGDKPIGTKPPLRVPGGPGAPPPAPIVYPRDEQGRLNFNAVCLPCRAFAQELRTNQDILAIMKAELARATGAMRALTDAALTTGLTPAQRAQFKKDGDIAKYLDENIPLQEAAVTRSSTTLDACMREKCSTVETPRKEIEVGGGGGGGRKDSPPPDKGGGKPPPGDKTGDGPTRKPMSDPRPPKEGKTDGPVKPAGGPCNCEAIKAQIADEDERALRYEAVDRKYTAEMNSVSDEIVGLMIAAGKFKDPTLGDVTNTPPMKEAYRRRYEAESQRDGARRDASRHREEANKLRRAYEECVKRCSDPPEPTVRVVIGVTGNNPGNPRDPMGGRTPTGTTPPPANVIGRIRLSPTSVVSVIEGDSVTFTMDRVEGTAGNISVQYETVSEGATPNVDFTAANGSFTWGEGDFSPRSVTIPTVDDKIAEGQEAFLFRLVNPGGGATLVSPSSARVLINDRGAPAAGTVQLSASAYSTAEGQGSVTITATRTGGSDGAIAVQYRTEPQSAVAGADFGPVNGTLTWANGNASNQTFTVSIVDDTLVEAPETFLVLLSGATLNGAASTTVLGAPASATVTITDNDMSTPVGPCGPQGNAWQPNTGAPYNCSGICQGMPASQTVTVQGDVVTVTPFDEGPPPPVAFPGCGTTVSSTRGDLSFFAGQRRHRGTITRTSNNAYSITVVTTSGPSGSCTAACSRSGP